MGISVATVIAYACVVSTVHQSIPPHSRDIITHLTSSLRFVPFSIPFSVASSHISLLSEASPIHLLARSDWHHMARQKSSRSQSTKLVYETHVLESCHGNAPLGFVLIINRFLSSYLSIRNCIFTLNQTVNLG